jgi:hypothetical protein
MSENKEHIKVLVGNKFTKEQKIIHQPKIKLVPVEGGSYNQNFQSRKLDTPVIAPPNIKS